MHPRLLHALVLLDPVIQKPKTQLEDPKEVFDHKLLISTATRLSAHRRDQWSSRQEAAESLSKSPFYQAWDKRVLARWIEYGLRDLPTPSYRLEKKPDPAKGLPVTLTTTTQQEVATFARPTTYNHATGSANSMNPTTHPDLDPALITSFPFYRPEPSIVFEQLPRLRASVLYIFGGKSHMCNHLLRMEKLRHTGIGIGGSGGTMAGRVKEVLFAEYGHLIAQEAVDQCAEAAVEWLGSEREHWEAEKLGSRAFSNGKSRVEETKVDGELRKAIPPIKRDGSGSGDRNSAPKL
jgi:hypothetical protein